jgi:hypothetical protein
LQDFYADICRGPRRLPSPHRLPNLAQLTPADPAGLQYLNDVASWLLRTHVEFANGAHADLTERARQLHDEVRLLQGLLQHVIVMLLLHSWCLDIACVVLAYLWCSGERTSQTHKLARTFSVL